MDHAQIELIEGTTRDAGKSQFFTPPKLAEKLVQWSNIPYEVRPTPRVLEPSAGNGAIVRPLVAAGVEVFACELDERYASDLRAALGSWNLGECPTDFLEIPGGSALFGRFDLCVGNFPFHLDLKGEFTLHALKFAPRVVAIYPSNVFYSEQREDLWQQVRPTRIAYMSKRAWPGATDYVALELVQRWPLTAERAEADRFARPIIEWWHEAWY